METRSLILLPAVLATLATAFAQNTATVKPAPLAATAPTAVPTLVPYSGIVQPPDGKTMLSAATGGEVLMTFLLFKDEQGGEPLWTESQTVAVDPTGRYIVQLGASSAMGLPLTTFASGEGRWLEVQIAGQAPKRESCSPAFPTP